MSKEQPAKAKPEEDWEADSALDTLMRSQEIRSNKDLMERVKKRAGRKVKALSGIAGAEKGGAPAKHSSIEDLKKTYRKKYGSR